MLMKVFNKGQVVIPAEIRRMLGINIGDFLDVNVDRKRKTIEIYKKAPEKYDLAGVFNEYARKKPDLTKKTIRNSIKKGMLFRNETDRF